MRYAVQTRRSTDSASAPDRRKAGALLAPSAFDCLIANLAAMAIAQGGDMPHGFATPDSEEAKHLNGALQ
jgi:hypothetical protein